MAGAGAKPLLPAAGTAAAVACSIPGLEPHQRGHRSGIALSLSFIKPLRWTGARLGFASFLLPEGHHDPRELVAE